jgi:hypothetical protein
MTPAVAPLFTRRYTEAAAIFDNLHSLHDVISDVLANETVPRNRKRAEILAAARAYRDDITTVVTPDEWLAMASAMGIENQGGPATGVLVAPPKATVEPGAAMAPGGAGHAGHRTDPVASMADSVARAGNDPAVRERFVSALFRILEDTTVQRRVAADSALRTMLLELAPLVPAEHREHYMSLLRAPPPSPPRSRKWG